MRSDGTVKVYEKPDAKDCFHHATCYLPDYKWEDIFGFSQEEIDKYQEIIESTAHLIMQFSQKVGSIMPQVFKIGKERGRCAPSSFCYIAMYKTSQKHKLHTLQCM